MAPNNYIINGERVSADRYNKEKYEDLRVRVPKGKKEIIQAHAEAQGQSVNAYINAAIDEKMAQEAVGSPTRPASGVVVSPLPSKTSKHAPTASEGRTEGN